ncbi:hypothetical protein CBS147343_4891 [Aspergillus niger]|uniref:DUF895 domain membrane protein n=1 Tax=Aspergillus phoenicis ATCC 13157 TaxID=1353007 RepID=A0A370PHG1_ASPPH|nr:hypothetical protein CBS133816_6335 [Aspergillus niger]RDK41628.1 hypothetical protein M752DRAFT_302100 [Aspergillus phoenicis ATCC 13157]KAI2862089.1 hypothetical protein CBS12448_4554 [Aspergillus niger]KAI2885121.1 hypothetical protein CBS13152_7634 [Aspergillus niger]KAI2921040.1 hypothetical protein CBS147371_2889 [Aspergillus niger]
MSLEKQPSSTDEEVQDTPSSIPFEPIRDHKVKWYRSTTYNALVLGLCNFLAPGIWTAMNSLGGGGSESPYLVDAANALTFGLMVFSCFFGSVVVRIVGIKWTLILGTVGYAPYAAGLYTHNRFGTDWLVLFGAALCGLSAGIFWMAESAIALSYPEPENQGRFLGLWLSFRVGGQILGGAINLGLNVHRNTAGSVSYAVFGVFIALQALGPAAGLLLTEPGKVMRRDGMKVKLRIAHSAWYEIKAMTRLFFRKEFLCIVPLIAQATYTEAVMFTYLDLWFSVRVRALGSFLSGVLALVSGNLLGAFLDSTKRFGLKTRSRGAFFVVLGLQGGWWIWATVVTTQYTNEGRSGIDWVDEGFAKGFVLYLMWVAGFQLNYMFLYFVVGNLAADEEEVVRISGLLRGMESAVQAVSYGLSSVGIMASVGGTYLNFGLWGISLLPAWLVIRQFGVSLEDRKLVRDYGRD